MTPSERTKMTTIARALPLAAAAALAAPARAEAPPPAIDAARAREHFDHARRIADADAGALWGRRLGGPLLFGDPRTRAVVANQADPDGKLVLRDGVYAGTLPDDVPLANTAVAWAGRTWTMVMWPLPDAPYARGRLLAHEMFHRLQTELGLPAASPANAHLDGVAGRTWLRLEWRALAEALIRAGDARRRAVADALTFRAHRRALAGAAAAEEERALEINEGLAEYTGYRLCGLPAAVLPDRVAARLEDAPPGGYSRNFAYLSGPAYGLLLDAASPRWRTKLAATSDLGRLLADASRFAPPADLARAAADAAKRYDGERLIAVEAAREADRLRRVADYRRRFIDGPTLRLPLGADVRYSFDPNGVEALDATRQVFEGLRVTDEWGVLEVSDGAMIERQDGRLVDATVAAPAQTPDGAKGDGWTLRLSPGWTVRPGARAGELTVAKAK
jgi:hypothetical protein